MRRFLAIADQKVNPRYHAAFFGGLIIFFGMLELTEYYTIYMPLSATADKVHPMTVFYNKVVYVTLFQKCLLIGFRMMTGLSALWAAILYRKTMRET